LVLVISGCTGTGEGGKITPADVGQTVRNAEDAAKTAAAIVALAEQVRREYQQIRELQTTGK
jgi:hypothetical protein